MVDSFLGTRAPTPADQCPFDGYTASDWANTYIVAYGGIDGSHHKDWVMDQIFRILNGTPVVVTLAEWGPSDQYPAGHREWRFTTGEPSEKYHQAVKEACTDGDDENAWEWETGIAP